MSKTLRISLVVLAVIIALIAYQYYNNSAKLKAEIDYHSGLQRTIILRSAGFEAGGKMPVEFTAKGANISPPLNWDNIPEGTRSLAIIVSDYDAPAPDFKLMTAVHWVVYNISPKIDSLEKNATEEKLNELKITTGKNFASNHAYTGPRPPIGVHSYFFRIYALDYNNLILTDPSKDELLRAMKGHILAYGELVGKY